MRDRLNLELLSPAGSLDAARAAIANGADAIYLGAQRFNARDDGAQLSLDELSTACALAHERGRRVYLTLNVLVKTHEVVEALEFLGEAVDRGIDAAIVQDIGLVSLIRRVYPALEIHGSTQMTVHDVSGARVMRDLGVQRVVLARENTLDDIAAIRDGAPGIGLESFVHGALCISYSGQCYMSGMISERSANRGSCAQSCRKDYVLTDLATGAELDRGYLISAKDLAAHDHLAAIGEAGVSCLKIEGRKKKPEYVATVTRAYRDWLDRLARGEVVVPNEEEVEPLVQIFSRGFTGGMYGGRAGRDYVTRDQPDNRGIALGPVVADERGELLIESESAIESGDGLGFEAPDSHGGPTTGFLVTAVERRQRGGRAVWAVKSRVRIPVGWRAVRTSRARLLDAARASFAALPADARLRKVRLDARVFGSAGAQLKVRFSANEELVEVRSESQLAPAVRHGLDQRTLREHWSKLGETSFAQGAIDTAGLDAALFLPVSELNRMRQHAVEELMLRADWASEARRAARSATIASATALTTAAPNDAPAMAPALIAQVYRIEDAEHAARAGADEIVLDPFLRHPAPPLSRVRALHAALGERGVGLRLRTPTIVRPEERPALQKWLDLELPILSGHLGLVAELAAAGRDVVSDYAVNVMNPHAAAEVFRLGARRQLLGVELTIDEMRALVAPWEGRNFDVLLFGRPEGMTIEHCILSAAFDRVPTTCRDLCVKSHTNVELTDPTGYRFPVATDSACRNRLLHSRPIDGSEFIVPLWESGIRSFHLLFNTPGDAVAEIVAGYRRALDEATHATIGASSQDASEHIRAVLGGAFTRGHFVRAV